MIRVWDPFVRFFHWTLTLSLAVAWLTSENMELGHSVAGYVAGALVAARVVWGFLAPGYARFSQFVRPPALVLGYLRAITARAESRFIGHNPAGGAMIVVLLAGIAVAVASGWLLTTDAFWGSEAMQRAHSIAAHGVLLLALLHVAGVALASLRHRENLVRAMVLGVKRAPGSGDVA